MDVLGTKTRKITTYGRKNHTRIINIHADLTPDRERTAVVQGTPTRPRALLDLGSARPVKTIKVYETPVLKAKRPPLQAKISQELRQVPSPKLKPRGKKVASDDEEFVLKRHVVRKRRTVIPRSPSASPFASPKAQRQPPHPLRQILAPVRGQVSAADDLVQKLARVSLLEAVPASTQSSPTSELLACCRQRKPLPFETVFSCPDFIARLPGRVPSGSKPVVRKLGEASYSEVFAVAASPSDAEVVVKVIPLLRGSPRTSPVDNTEAELPDCSEIPEVVREIELTRHMAHAPGGGFTDFLGAFVVEGKYPSWMLDKWDEFENGTRKSLNVRPDGFSESQQYAFLVLANGGLDLETYKFDNSRGWVQAAAVFWQVAAALARAERWTKFEHRDLHEGQVLVAPAEMRTLAPVDNYLDPEQTAVRTTVVDFGLSRLDLPERGAVFSHLPQECYEGVGDQWDVYRRMRDCIDSWEAYNPRTNVLWLEYLASHLLRRTKTLRKPTARKGKPKIKTAADVKKEVVRLRAEAALSVLHLTEKALSGFTSATEVVAWGRQQSWIV